MGGNVMQMMKVCSMSNQCILIYSHKKNFASKGGSHGRKVVRGYYKKILRSQKSIVFSWQMLEHRFRIEEALKT